MSESVITEPVAAMESTSASFFADKLTKRQKLTRRFVRLAIVTAMVVAVALAAKYWPTTRVAANAPAAVGRTLPVTTFRVEPVESYARMRSYTGILREARRSQLSFQRSGELLELSVDEGDTIVAGQMLGRLDARHIRARRAQLEAQSAEARAVLAELEAGPRKETIAAKRAELRAQQAQREVLAGQLKRRKQLLQSNSVSREEYETFFHDYEAAVARADVVQRQLDEMVAGTRKEKVAAQRARIAQLDAQLTDVAHDLEDTRLVAPFAGSVTERFVDEGHVIAAGAAVLEVIDDANLEAWIGLSPSAANTLRVGQEYEISVDGVPTRATLQSLAPDVERLSRTRNIILRLHAAAPAVFPGQVVRFAVSEQVAEAGYWVPTTALTRGRRGLWSLFVVQDGVVARREVELLDTVGTDSFVRGTLQPGDEIVASGTHRVVVGQQVAIQNETLAQRKSNP